MPIKVLIVNKFYYPRGGDCVCVLNEEKLLTDHGHEVAIFSMQYPENIPSKWAEYFATEVKFGGGVSLLLKAVKRTLGMGDIKKTFERLVTDFKPDVVHLNNIHSYLSPVLARIARKHGARVLWTLHDYKLLCPAYSCTRPDGTICEECFKNKRHVITNRCMKGSLAASAIAWLEAKKWSRKVLEKHVDLFICPSRFMHSKMLAGQFSETRLTTLCNFIDPVKLDTLKAASTAERQSDTYCYVGRLSSEKGVTRLLEVAASLPQFKLKVAGDGPLGDELREKYARCTNIEFLGRLDAVAVSRLLSRSHASIIPSQWYENNPLGVIESLCAGTPVIGANIGGIPELINPDNGVIYSWHDGEAMKQAITDVMTREWKHDEIASQAQESFSPENYYKRFIALCGE